MAARVAEGKGRSDALNLRELLAGLRSVTLSGSIVSVLLPVT